MTGVQHGAYIYSKTRFRADDSTLPVGGLIIDSWDDDTDGMMPAAYQVVTVYRGKIEYFNIAKEDAAVGSHHGEINPPVIRDTLRAIATDIARGGDPTRHTTAQTVLAAVYSRCTPARSGR